MQKWPQHAILPLLLPETTLIEQRFELIMLHLEIQPFLLSRLPLPLHQFRMPPRPRSNIALKLLRYTEEARRHFLCDFDNFPILTNLLV